MDWTTLFPHLAGLLLLLRCDVGSCGLVLYLAPWAQSACCPSCHYPSEAVHSHYLRHVTDVPLGDQQVSLLLHVRRFRCRNPACRRKTCADDLSPVVSRSARRSAPLQALLEDIGISLGGRPGSRFAGRHHLSASRSTLVRLVRRLPLPPQVEGIAILGVDDFALRRHHHYGTLLVDVERHRVLDLWPERTAEPFIAWLGTPEQRPEVICRDRGGAYADTARQGAPGAVQVADRFHLARNAGDALKRVLARHAAAVRAVTAVTAPAVSASAESVGAALTAATPRTQGTTREESANQRRTQLGNPTTRARRRAHYDEVLALRAQGLSLTVIAEQVGLSRPTVRKYLTADTFPEWAPRRTLLRAGAVYTVYLQHRWAQGRRDATVLWSELQAQGFTGSLRMVQRAVAAWRPQPWVRGPRRRPAGSVAGSPRPARPAGAGSSSAGSSSAGSPSEGVPQQVDVPQPRGLSPQQAAWLLLRPPATLNDSEQVLRTQLVESTPEIRLAHELVETFRAILKQRNADRLDSWLQSAITSCIPELRGFAFGLKRDYDAVRTAATVAWSSGQVEGQVTKVKLIKRQMYGRANFDLLKRRVLLAG
jgi:transposase